MSKTSKDRISELKKSIPPSITNYIRDKTTEALSKGREYAEGFAKGVEEGIEFMMMVAEHFEQRELQNGK